MLTAVAAAPDALKAPYTAAGASFKVVMSTVGFKWRPNQYRGYIFDLVRAIGFEGDVELENPDHMFWVVTIESDGQSGLPEMPTRWIFGRQVAVADDRCGLLGCVLWSQLAGGMLGMCLLLPPALAAAAAHPIGCHVRCEPQLASSNPFPGSLPAYPPSLPAPPFLLSYRCIPMPAGVRCSTTMPCPNAPTLGPPPWTLNSPSS